MKIVITLSALNQKGGVVSYYNSILPHLRKETKLNVFCFEMGSRSNVSSLFHPLIDQLRFNKFLSREKPDLVHVNPSLGFKSFIRDGLFIWQAKKKKIKVLVFFRGWLFPFEKTIERYLLWFFNKTYLKADKFIVLASAFKKSLERWGVKSEIFLQTTAVDDSLLNTVSAEKIRQTNIKSNLKILFLSRLEKSKGIFELIDAFQVLLNRGHDVFLNIAGEGSVKAETIQYIKQLNIPSDRIKFLGHVSGAAKTKVFKENDIYCLPSYSEGMPNSILEAMAFGMPILTTPVGGVKDFFKEGKMGFFVSVKNPTDIVSSFEKLIQNKQMLQTIKSYNFNFSDTHFKASIVAEKLISIYNKFP